MYKLNLSNCFYEQLNAVSYNLLLNCRFSIISWQIIPNRFRHNIYFGENYEFVISFEKTDVNRKIISIENEVSFTNLRTPSAEEPHLDAPPQVFLGLDYGLE